jgi:hypothetical protein
VDRLVQQGELNKVKLSASRSAIPRDDLERYIWERIKNRPYYSSPIMLRVMYLPCDDPELGRKVGEALDKKLAQVAPGCVVTVNGNRLLVYWPKSAGHSVDINHELDKLIGE